MAGLQNLLEDVFKLRVSKGLINKTLKRIAASLEGAVRELEKALPDSKQVNVDENSCPSCDYPPRGLVKGRSTTMELSPV
jgi:hypothetical protein